MKQILFLFFSTFFLFSSCTKYHPVGECYVVSKIFYPERKLFATYTDRDGITYAKWTTQPAEFVLHIKIEGDFVERGLAVSKDEYSLYRIGDTYYPKEKGSK